MPETRMLPHKKPSSTGIERVNQAPRATTSGATGAGSHVSAAPGAGEKIHNHVLAARSPGGAVPARGPAGNATRVTGRQDAQVQLIDRRAGAPAGRGGLSVDAPTVQLMDKIPRRGGASDASDPGFTVSQLQLIGSLLGKYEEGVLVIGNHEEALKARDAIDKIAHVLKGGSAPSPKQVIAATSTQILPAEPTEPTEPTE